MKRKLATAAFAASLLSAGVTAQLSEYGIEGMGVVSTPHTEIRASVSPDGRHIAWGSTDRPGGAGGWDLWQARLQDQRWQDPQPLSVNSTANDFDPAYSADGRWLYFFSNREGGQGGDDLYRAAIPGDGSFGVPENLGAGVNSAGNEWAPTPSADGRWLMFASDGFGGAGRHDLFMARWNGHAFADPRPVPGANSAVDDFDAAWIDGGKALVFARSDHLGQQPIRLYVAHCDGTAYADIEPWSLSFNSAEGSTQGPALDPSRPGEILVSGEARAPRAGKLDIYRARVPGSHGKPGCLPG